MRLLPYLKEHKSSLVIAFLFFAVSTACYLYFPFVLRDVIDESLPSKDFKSVAINSGIYLSIFALFSVTSFFKALIISKMGLKIVATLKAAVFTHVLSLPLSFFDSHTPGNLLTRVENDIENIKRLYSQISIDFFSNIVNFISVIVVLLFAEPAITFRILLIFPPLMLATFFFVRYVKALYKKVRENYSVLTGVTTEYVQAVPEIQVSNCSKLVMRNLETINSERYTAEKKAAIANYSFWSFFSFTEIFVVVLIIYLGAFKINDGSLTIGTFILFFEFTRKLYSPIRAFSEHLNGIQKALVSAGQVFEILNIRTEQHDSVKNKAFDKNPSQIEFKDVTFAYDDEPVLKNVSFVIPRGKCVAVVGPSGSGKTTIASILLRYCKPDKGAVFADETNIMEFHLEAWRASIGFVPQEAYLFPGTVGDNIRTFDSDIMDDKVVRAASIVQAMGFIDSMPQGFDTPLGDRSGALSIGQKQLISFARALVIEPNLLILDEATSAIDPDTEALIQDAISTLLANRTSLVIAHRLSTIVNADLIIVLKEGEIVAKGAHKSLMDSCQFYRDMHEKQNSEKS